MGPMVVEFDMHEADNGVVLGDREGLLELLKVGIAGVVAEAEESLEVMALCGDLDKAETIGGLAEDYIDGWGWGRHGWRDLLEQMKTKRMRMNVNVNQSEPR